MAGPCAPMLARPAPTYGTCASSRHWAAPTLGALRMSEFGLQYRPACVGALGSFDLGAISPEIRAMALWAQGPGTPRRRCTRWRSSRAEDPKQPGGLTPHEARLRSMHADDGDGPRRRTGWLVSRGMLDHPRRAADHGHDARAKSTNPTIRCVSPEVIIGPSGLRLLNCAECWRSRDYGQAGISQIRRSFRALSRPLACSPRSHPALLVPWFACRPNRSPLLFYS